MCSIVLISDVCSADLVPITIGPAPMTRMDFMSVLLGIIVRYILVAGRGRWDDPIGHAPSIACLPVERLGDRNAPTIILNPQVGRELTEPGHRIGQPFLVDRGVDRRDASDRTSQRLNS